MGGALAGGGGPVMATGTGTGDPRMIKSDIGPVGGDVAIVAHITGRKMGGALAGGGGAIMTTETGACHTGVVKIHGGPVGGDVAVLAGVGRLQMRRALAGGGCPVMATGTGSCCPRMIEPGAGPSRGVVAGVTLVRTLNMLSAFPHCHNIIVAIQTRPGHRVMVHPKNGYPGLSRVAVGAKVVRPNMIRTFWC